MNGNEQAAVAAEALSEPDRVIGLDLEMLGGDPVGNLHHFRVVLTEDDGTVVAHAAPATSAVGNRSNQ